MVCCGVRPRLQRRVHGGFAPPSLLPVGQTDNPRSRPIHLSLNAVPPAPRSTVAWHGAERLSRGFATRFSSLREVGTLSTMSASCQPDGAKQQPLLQEAQRARILTTLVGNLAHDLNNLLTVLTCNSDLLLADDRVHGEQRVMLREMAEAARQAGELTTALQSFSGRPSMSRRRCRLGDALAEMGRLLRHALPEGVE